MDGYRVRPENVLAYATIVVDHSRQRDVAQAAYEYQRDPSPWTLTVLSTAVERAATPGAAEHPHEPETITDTELMMLELPALTMVVDSLLPEGCQLLIGKSKLGKSRLAMQIAICVAAGGRLFGEFPTLGGDVLYIDAENGKRRIQHRMGAMLRGEPTTGRLHFAETWPRGDDGLVHLMAWLDAHPAAKMVVIDPLVHFRRSIRPGESLV